MIHSIISMNQHSMLELDLNDLLVFASTSLFNNLWSPVVMKNYLKRGHENGTLFGSYKTVLSGNYLRGGVLVAAMSVEASQYTNGVIKVLPPKTAEEILAREIERKARTTLLSFTKIILLKFHKMTDANRDGELSNLDLVEMMNQRRCRSVSTEDANQKFLSLESDVKVVHRSRASDVGLARGNVAFVSEKLAVLMICPQMDHEDLEQLDSVDWTSHSEDELENYAFMACNSSGSETQREQLGDASIEIQAYTQALNKVEAQLVAHQQSQLWYEEKIRFMKIDLDDKTDVLTYHKKLLAEDEKEKEDLKAKDKAGLGYGNQLNKGVLSYENEVFQSVFVSRTSETKNSPVNDRYAEGMHVVPPLMTGIYISSGPDKEIDDSQFTYGPKQSKPSESDARSSDFNSYESNCSEETHESMPESVVNEPNVVSQPKVWFDAPIIEEYELDSEDEHVSLPTKEQEIPSFANKHVELNKQKGKGNVQREIRPVWNNVQRMNHQNQFVPKAVLTRTGKIPVNTARHNFNSQAVLTNDARKISIVKPFVNKVRPKTIFHKTHSPFRRPFNNTTALKTTFTKQKVNTVGVNLVSVIGQNRETVVKTSAGCN
ncbi:ribonuclease H-like domain-containing protein [Tanacetum coccineum]